MATSDVVTAVSKVIADEDDEFLEPGNTNWFSPENIAGAIDPEYEGLCPCCGCGRIRMLWMISSCRNKKCPIWIARVAWKLVTFPFLKSEVAIWFEKDHFVADLVLPKDHKEAKAWALKVIADEREANKPKLVS